jgi:hypothetical protein
MPITKADQNVFQPVLTTGSTTARTFENRFADVINVKDFGAKGDGVTDDYAAIQAALDSIVNPKPTAVYFPQGNYMISNTLRVKTSYTGLYCDAFLSGNIIVTNFSVSEAILVRNPTAGGSIAGFSMSNIGLFRGASSTYQKGLVLESCSNTHLTDVEIGGFPTCLDIRGGLNCHYTSIRLGDYYSTNTTPDVALLQIDGSSYVSEPAFFTHIFTNSLIGADMAAYCLKIRGGDYLTFSNTYFGGGRQGDVLIAEGTIYANYDNYFDNCYFDFAQDNPDTVRAAITITGGNKNVTKITDCRFGPWGVGVKIDTPYDPAIQITGCLFQRTNTPILMESTSQYTSLVLTGNQFRDSGYLSGNANCLEIKDASQITITGNAFYWDYAGWVAGGSLLGTKKVIAITSGATIENISITGNVFNSTPFTGVAYVDFENLGTVNKLVITGNASSNTTNTIVGSIIGNQENANPLSLDWYQEGTFNPVVAFGGSSVGVTYTSRVGNYTRIGNRMIFDIQIQLLSKGGLTGDMTISGFPYPLSPSGISTGNLSISLQGVDGIGSANIDGLFNTTTTAIARYINSSGNAVNVTAANMRDNSLIFLSGVVQVA